MIVNGDCLSVMPTMEQDSIDAIISDPPYGLSFMGKDWDHGIPGVAFWLEALRVAKPGAHIVAFGGTRTFHRLTCAIEDAGWEIRDCLGWLYGSGFPKSKNIGNGFGTALKPAWEPIILARKPLQGTVAANVHRFGTGALNIDGCRVATDDMLTAPKSDPAKRAGVVGTAWQATGDAVRNAQAQAESIERTMSLGRWPANIAHDGSEEVLAVFPDVKAGVAVRHNSGGKNCHSDTLKPAMDDLGYGDSGSAARFFYCAKASKADRGDNNHPTVKPTKLMRWLCRLITPPNGLILDPFAGSGSTGKAALAEGFRFMGIELQPEYCAIAVKRMETNQPMLFVA